MIALLVAIGGAIGAVSRYELGRWIQPSGAGTFPWGTFAINLFGSFLLGFFYGYFDITSERKRALLGVGFCGGFTTFSTFSYDAVRMMQDGQSGRAAVYVIASVALCIIGAFTGMLLGTAALRGR